MKFIILLFLLLGGLATSAQRLSCCAYPHATDEVLIKSAEPPAEAIQIFPKSKRLQNWYKLPVQDVHAEAAKLESSGVKVQLRYYATSQYTPDDTHVGSQSYLTVIKAFEAWDVNQGDGKVIGIVDTGVEINHPDLNGAIAVNAADPINTVDDDLDGYTDNYYGWNVASDNPQIDDAFVMHGTEVSGVAAATSDNTNGIAGVGFNAKFLPVKAGENGYLTHGYEGIVYAAENGASIINCSWANSIAGTYEQDVIDYVTKDLGVLVIAAAGNDNSQVVKYPGHLNGVMAVAGTEDNDVKWQGSNFHFDTDISAPANALTTSMGSTYANVNGTSLSAPMVCGAAALVSSHFPSYGPMAIKSQLKSTADNIESSNASYVGQLGGRLNMHRALTETGHSYFEVSKPVVDDLNGGNIIVGDDLEISVLVANYLALSGNLEVELSSTSPYVSVIDGAFSGTAMNPDDSINTNSDPFQVEILAGVPINEVLRFKVLAHDGSDSTTYYLEVIANGQFVNIDENDITATITSRGMLGFNDYDQLQGIGFKYKDGNNMLYDGGLMIGVDGKVMDMQRGNGNLNDIDFAMESPAYKVSAGLIEGTFNDDPAIGIERMGLTIHHTTTARTDIGHEGYITRSFEIINKGAYNFTDLYVGYFLDWDIGDYENNAVDVDGPKYLAYGHEVGVDTVFVGAQVLSGTMNHYASTNESVGGGVHPNIRFITEDKFTVLSNNRPRSEAGGHDISHTVSQGPLSLASGDTITVTFALLAAESLVELQEYADSAYFSHNGVLPDGAPLGIDEQAQGFQVYPNPTHGMIYVSGDVKKIKVYTIQGRLIEEVSGSSIEINQKGIYILEIDAGQPIRRKILVH